MRTFIITSCLIGSGFIILLASGFFNSLLLFLLIGQIPGSPTTLTAETMQLISMLGVGAIILTVVLRSRHATTTWEKQREKSFRILSSFFVDRQNGLRP